MRVGDSFWHCKRIDEDNSEYSLYELPKEHKTRFRCATVQPMGSLYRDLAEYGENVKDYRVIIVQPALKWDGVFNSGDRMFLDGRKPTEEDMLDDSAENANYEVEDAVPYNLTIHVICKRRVAE
ncbi:MAG: hypothetical protein NC131_12855 [Roseburia sp.]|nr:hypothetical protein [Roseburia sp.]